MIRSYFTAAVPGLIISDVNFNFSCFVLNHGFCFLQVWCPAVFASSGHCVLLKWNSGHFVIQGDKKNVQHWNKITSS